jgi:hypothetical protein
MDLAAIQAAVGSLKAAADISKSLMQMKVTADVQGKVIELQGALLDAQNAALQATTAQFELLERVRSVEAELKARNDWDGQRGRYALVAPWRGPAQVYALKRDAAADEAPHFLCANCFTSGRRSIVNPVKSKDGFLQMVCPNCRSTLDTGYRGIGPAKFVEDIGSDG